MSKKKTTVHKLQLNNFKGYRVAEAAEHHALHFENADMVLVTGKNGVGKTSLLTALDVALNSPQSNLENYRTKGLKEGTITLNEKESIELTKKTNPSRENHLHSTASFFYQDKLEDLSTVRVVSLLAPENLPGQQIIGELKKSTPKLEDMKNTVEEYFFQRDFDEERKQIIQELQKAIGVLPEDSIVKQLLSARSLVIKSGNLKSNWQSELRNTASDIIHQAKISFNIDRPLSAVIREIHTGLQLLVEVQNSNDEKGQQNTSSEKVVLQKVKLICESLPPEIEMKQAESSVNFKEDYPSRVFYFSEQIDGARLYADLAKQRADFLEAKQKELSKLIVFRDRVSNESDDSNLALLDWLYQFETNHSAWKEVWVTADNHHTATEHFDQLARHVSEVEKIASGLFEKLNQDILKGQQLISRYQSEVFLFQQFEHLFPLLHALPAHHFKEGMTIQSLIAVIDGELKDCETSKTQEPQVYLGEVYHYLKDWAALELEAEHAVDNDIDNETRTEILTLIAKAKALVKQESGVRSKLLASISQIPKEELENLMKTLNELLKSFHFPPDFLPIRLVQQGRPKDNDWTFQTSSKLGYEQLSTGQRTQVAVCWLINLNLALSDNIGHKVVGFDDFTTSLDMNQLIPACVQLRKLAYAPSDSKNKRQVFVTSHHEDMTNRLMDYLLPPEGYKMKVLQFEDWNVETGPQYSLYDVELQHTDCEGLELALEHLVELV